MNEEILNNIWNILSSDPSLNIKAANFDEWKVSFAQNKDIQTNVYNYLKENHTLEAANQEQWTSSVVGKTSGTQEVDAPVVPNVKLDVTDLASELSSLGLSEEEFANYETALNNVFVETEAAMVDIIERANAAPEKIGKIISAPYSSTYIVSQTDFTEKYVFDEFLNKDKTNKEEAKQRWIQQEREKIQTEKLEEVYEQLKDDVLPWWTGPVGFAEKIVAPFSSLLYQPDLTPDLTPVTVDETTGETRELTEEELEKFKKDKVDYNIESSSGYRKKELEYEKVRNLLYNEYSSKLKELNPEGEKIAKNIKLSIGQFDTIDAELKRLEAAYRINPPTTQAEVDYFNGLILKRKGLYSSYKSNLAKLNEINVNFDSIASIADMVKRTYSNIDVITNRVESTVLKLKSGLTKTAKELTVGTIEKFSDVDLNSEENLELVSDFMRPLAKGVGNLGDFLDKTSLELYQEAEKINEFTEKRQALGEVSGIEDFGEFVLDLFSEQSVNSAITISTGGLGLGIVAAGATGNKFTAMDMELENGRYNPRTGKMEKIEISPLQYYTAGIGYGLAEYVTEKVSLDNLKLGTKGFRNALDKAGGKYTLKSFSFNKALKSYRKSMRKEGGAEFFASVLQNGLDKYVLENKEVGIMDGAMEAYFSGAVMSGLGFNAPALAAAAYRAATPSKGWDKINENTKRIIELSEVYNQIILGPKNQETLDQAKAIREQMDNLLKDNLMQKGLAEKRIDQLSNNDKRTLLDLETKRNRIAARIDKLSDGKNTDKKYVKSIVEAHLAQINNLESKKDAILNNAMYSSDMRKTTKLTLEDAILKGLNIKSIEADNNQDALKQALEHVDQSDLEADQKKALKDKLKQTFGQVDVHVHGFAIGKEQGLPIQFQMKSNATNAESGNASVHSHELGHNSIFAKIIEGNGDMLGLVNEFEKYIRNRFKGLSEIIDQEGRFQLTQYATDAKTVREELKKELGKEPTQEQINDRIYLNKVSIAEEKLAVATDYIRKYHNEKIDKSFKGKLLDMWSKTRNPDDINEIQNGEDVYSMLTSFVAGFEKGEMSGLAAKVIEGKVKARERDAKKVEDTRIKEKKSATKAVNELGKMGWTNKTWKEQGADFAIKEMQDNKMLDGLILAQPHVGIDNDTFLSTTYAELLPHIRNYKPENENPNGLFGWVNPQIGNKAKQAYNAITKSEIKGTKEIGEKTKEGDVKVQVAAEKSTEMEAFETEDLSPEAQAKKKADEAKVKEKVESEFRKKIGIETGSDLYNKVLESARKALLKAYEVGTAARNIQRKLRNEANEYLFKSVKNFLGTKDYVKNLKKFRVPIVNALFTADLVQLERNVPENERIFTEFVKKLTSKEEVQAAVDQNLLPKSALNIIDKGTAVSLYKKKMPTEKQFLSFFYTPLINPVTGARSGLRGTRKDGLAKGMAGALAYDATLEVAQEKEIIDKRTTLAEINNTEILKDDIQRLADVINRDPNVKFSTAANKTTYKQKAIKIRAGKVIIDFTQAQKVLDDIFNDNSKISYYKNLTDKQADIYGGKFIIDAIVDAYHNRGIERVDSKAIVKFIKKNKRKKDKISTVYEQFFISSAVIALEKISGKKAKVNLVVREGGIPDVHFELDGRSIGLEIKMDSARGVSQTWKFNDSSGTFSNQNPVDVDATNKLIKKIQDTAKNSIFKGMDFVNGVTNLQVKELRIFKQLFNHSEKVTAAYLEYHYTNKAIPEYFINIGNAGLFYMLDSKNPAINGEILAIAEKLGIPRLNGTFDLISRMNIGSVRVDGTRSTTIRIEPMIDSKSKENFPNSSTVNLSNKKDMSSFVKEINNSLVSFSRSANGQTLDKAIMFSRSTSNKTKGITVLDFDDTLAITKSKIKFTRQDGTTGTLNAEEYASTYENLLDQGYTFDFSEFNKVVKGKKAPLFEKAIKLQNKFGPENMFVLTARPAESAQAIHKFLKENGLNIPLRNITGLANSTAEAKALWVANKVGEGYNDFYFADDALQNVQAVKNMLDQFDVKSKVQQAKVKFSKNMSNDFNKILEKTTGVPAKEIIAGAVAKKRGARKGKYKFFVPPSAEDFTGLLYYFMGKGKQGDKDAAFFKKALIDPLNRAYTELNEARQSIANDYRNLKKEDKETAKKLNKTTPDGDFTYGDAVRIYLWNKAGFDVPGLNQKDIDKLIELVTNDPKLMIFAYKLGKISKRPEGYTEPSEHWQAGDIRNDLDDATGRIGRKEFFTDFIENSDIIFSKDNLNKIESIYGSNFREALEDILYRTKTGTNRTIGGNRLVNQFTNWINGSVGTVMFFNARSAILQTLSTVNFINWGDNNIFKAAKAFANQPQYWKDFAMIFNSDKLKQRRSGLSMDINANELATYLNKSKSKPKAAIAWLLSKGFLPTQIADSFAISAGGATFYRNRVNTYLEQGLSKKEAETKAWSDFSELSEATQQSARPDMVSQQQASPLGKWLLNFQNTPMQYARLMKKAVLDLVNNRGSKKANISRIIYYGAVQNLIFYTMQSALFAMMFSDEEDDDEFFEKKKDRVANSMVDGLLRGMGIAGGVISTMKNMIIKFVEEDSKGYRGKPIEKVALEMTNISPVVGIKFQKIVKTPIQGYGYNKDVIKNMETFDIDNPLWGSVTSIIEGATNVPLNRFYNKTQNLRAATRDDAEAWQRLALISGWSTWNIGMQNRELEEIKEEIKKEKEKTKKKKKKRSNRQEIRRKNLMKR